MNKRQRNTSLEFITSSLDMWRIDNLLNAFKKDEVPEGQDFMKEFRKGRMVGPRDVPPNIVTMNCLLNVSLSDRKGEQLGIRLVYPVDENEGINNISVFSPLGKALLGMKEGEIKILRKSKGKAIWVKVEKILYQPERSGDYQF